MTDNALVRARRTEIEFVWFRWVAVVYAAIQTGLALRDVVHINKFVVPLAVVLTVGLAAGNLAIWSAAHRAETRRQLATIGAVAFSLDIVALLAMVWVFTTSPADTVWVIGYVLPLEGAARYGRAGALVAATAFTASAFLREYYMVAQFSNYDFSLKNVEFRSGMAYVIAITAGTFARSLRQETERADHRAAEAVEAARREAEARERLQELDQLKSDFIAITSHELRTPVAAIRGFVDTLLRRMDDLSDDEVREFLGIVHGQTDRLARLVEDLLVAGRIEAGQLTFRPEEVTVADLLDHLVYGLGKGAPLILRREEAELPVTITIDPQRLNQILTNLLQNALKFSPPGAVVELVTAPAGNTAVVFSVTDSGPGIPETERERIFERFHQVDASDSRSAQGTGLGLYITKELTIGMGGTIECLSSIGHGSTFTVTIPRTAMQEDSTALPPPSRAARSG